MSRKLTKKETAKLLGEQIRSLRLKKKLSQADLCYEGNIDLSTLSRLERGQLNVTLNTLHAIATVLKVDIIDLFDFS